MSIFRDLIKLAACLALALAANAADRWKLQYFYDEDKSDFEIRDFQCPSADRCIAAGIISEKGHARGAALVTNDGGEHWSLIDLKEQPTCLYFINDTLGWMATKDGIWRSDESGRSWTKLQKLESIESLYFFNSMRGYAVGFPKAAYETSDGGKTWAKVPAADQPDTPKDRTVYDWVMFDGSNHGIILGYAGLPGKRRSSFQMNPERAMFGSGEQVNALMLETIDAGKTWIPSQKLAAGDFTEVKFMPNAHILGLFQYRNLAEDPNEIFELSDKMMRSLYHQPDRVITDLAPMRDGTVFIAGVEAPGRLKHLPIPGKLKISRGNVEGGLETWLDMEVDYRAVAQRAIISGIDSRHVWVATDSGMILKLVSSAP